MSTTTKLMDVADVAEALDLRPSTVRILAHENDGTLPTPAISHPSEGLFLWRPEDIAAGEIANQLEKA